MKSFAIPVSASAIEPQNSAQHVGLLKKIPRTKGPVPGKTMAGQNLPREKEKGRPEVSAGEEDPRKSNSPRKKGSAPSIAAGMLALSRAPF